MSQNIFKLNDLTLMAGYDRPLDYHFIVVIDSKTQDIIFSNLYLEYMGMDIKEVKSIAEFLNINAEKKLYDDLLEKRSGIDYKCEFIKKRKPNFDECIKVEEISRENERLEILKDETRGIVHMNYYRNNELVGSTKFIKGYKFNNVKYLKQRIARGLGFWP